MCYLWALDARRFSDMIRVIYIPFILNDIYVIQISLPFQILMSVRKTQILVISIVRTPMDLLFVAVTKDGSSILMEVLVLVSWIIEYCMAIICLVSGISLNYALASFRSRINQSQRHKTIKNDGGLKLLYINSRDINPQIRQNK